MRVGLIIDVYVHFLSVHLSGEIINNYTYNQSFFIDSKVSLSFLTETASL